MDAREQRGLVIARTMRIERLKAGGWRVPSQTFVGTYAVWDTAEGQACSCPDFQERQLPCKHVFAVQFTLFRQTERDADGTTVTTTSAMARITYGQDWPAYNTAQTTEKETFVRLLHDLCAGIAEPEQTLGRPRLPLRDMVFAAGFKVYSTVSTRRFMTDLRDAAAKGLITKAPHYNSVIGTMERPDVTPIIRTLITESSLPLKAVETDFAADSTGFGTSRSFRYYAVRYGKGAMGERRDWLKLHAMVGCRTNVVTSVEVTDRRQSDTLQFPALLADTASRFDMGRVMADGAYLSMKNLDTAAAAGAEPFIPFRSDARGGKPSPTWNRLFHFFSLHREAFLAVYHQRSNVEATFSMMKRKFGDAVRSKTPVAQVNELLLKVLAHNICCLVHAIHELRLTPIFWAGSTGAQELAPK